MAKSEQGISHPSYKIIPRTLIFLTRGDEVLLIKGTPTKRLWANRYNGLGGHIERGEDALTAAKRELNEESSLEVKDLRLVGTVLIDVDVALGIGLFVFCGTYNGGESLASVEGALEWVPVAQLADYALVEDLRVILPRALVARQGEPFHARSFYDEQERLTVVFGE
jgi:8-oxo-dGTP diphosphatase